MQTNPIHLREQGTVLSSSALEHLILNHNWNLTVIPTQNTFKNSCPNLSSPLKTELIWIKGQENYIITLEAHGRCILHSIFPTLKSIALSKSSEIVLKAALGQFGLIMILKSNTSNHLQFFIVRNENLLNFNPAREQVLNNLEVDSSDIEEIDTDYLRITVKKGENLEVWSFLHGENRVLASVPYGSYSKYTRGYIVMAFHSEGTLYIVVKNLDNDKRYQLNFVNGSYPYHCEVLNGKLVIGMTGHLLQMIDLDSGCRTVIGKCVRFYEFLSSDDGFVLLENGFGVFLSRPGEKIHCGKIGRIFVNRGSEFFVYSRESNSVVVLYPNGISKHIFIDRMFKINTIGVSQDSHTLYIGSNKGTISVFD